MFGIGSINPVLAFMDFFPLLIVISIFFPLFPKKQEEKQKTKSKKIKKISTYKKIVFVLLHGGVLFVIFVGDIENPRLFFSTS